MTAIIRKLRRKRKLSSELHSRWGDVSITYPTEGSWSQWDQPSRINLNVAPEMPSEQRRRHSSPEARHRESSSSRPESTLHSGDTEERKSSVDSAMTIPTGHYDAKLRSRSTKDLSTQKVSEHRGIVSEQRGLVNPWDEICSSDEAEEDIIPPPKGPKRLPRELNRLKLNADMDDYSRASKSPPLSVTSRMRRCSQQSNATELTASVSGTTSSKHTSFTSSVPSVSPEDSRHMSCSPFQEQKFARRPKPREAEPVREQELVPSYDELYG
ncbi:uncharacterized protein CDV56_107092 [Aspergillus thermomutatus]|uniref:Uncharacterized protein n=1 Tax=Aspergillus thermomutatus TaxID=41047 RepID=A0A397HIK2_ASPTH|nr:uncharacterized protein CDV56_107092 [Aspergillus thermomutatus]RHZ62787.1 hypothetical protein CDV56_107092 [Aspergillus thermomutatus]